MAFSDSDDFVSYGTPLEPIEENEIPTKKPCLMEDQVVKDKYGRRRFHGAFTGGFSAGFFNTVGSLEGWKPSSFTSSRSNKQKIPEQKPEHFMDEEDMGEFGIAPIVLKAKGDYANERKIEKYETHSEKNLGTFVFNNILQPIRETIGMKLLMKMGWKPGQGVGPRTKKREKKNIMKLRAKLYGFMGKSKDFANDRQSDSDSDSDSAGVDYAPTDYDSMIFLPKNNFFGIGYQGLPKTMALSSHQSDSQEYTLPVVENKCLIRGQSFGVGAFEDDDEDIYARDDLSQYDFSLATDNRKQETTKKNSTNRELEGFATELKKESRKFYNLPVLPKDFKCLSTLEAMPSSALDENVKKSGSYLPEGFASEAMPERKGEPTYCTNEQFTPSSSAISKTIHFRPFAFDPAKQQRFEKYLSLVDSAKRDALSGLQPVTMTSWDKEREKVEFRQAAALFKSVNEMWKKEFLPASQEDDLSNPLATVEKFCDEDNDCRNAAKMKMFGALTRRIEVWSPCQLLCKRFNIPQPVQETTESSSVRPHKTNKEDRSRLEFANPYKFSTTSSQIDRSSSANSDRNIELPSIKPDDEPEKCRDVEENKNKMSLFRAIFLDSEDEDNAKNIEVDNDKSIVDERESPCDESQLEKNFKNDILYEEIIINSKRNTSPARGIFENIHLANKGEFSESNFEVSKSKDEENSEKIVAGTSNDPPVYGPKLPEKIAPISNYSFNSYVAPDDSQWVEKKVHMKKHKKQEKKSKKSKHKHKHKHRHKS